jgi:hypothetical protein
MVSARFAFTGEEAVRAGAGRQQERVAGYKTSLRGQAEAYDFTYKVMARSRTAPCSIDEDAASAEDFEISLPSLASIAALSSV